MIMLLKKPSEVFYSFITAEEHLAKYWESFEFELEITGLEFEELDPEELEELEELEEFEELEELEELEPEELEEQKKREEACKLLYDIGAKDYMLTIIPIIEDRGSEIFIEGYGILSKRTPQWKNVMDYLTAFVCEGRNERTKFLLSHEDYEVGESWWNLGIRESTLNVSPKEFNKGSLRRFLNIFHGYQEISKNQLRFFNRALINKQFSLHELWELEDLRCDFGDDIALLEKVLEIEPNEREAFLLDAKGIEIPYDFSYEEGNRIIKTPSSFAEIAEEGEKMGHCVGSYVNAVNHEKSIILFLRDNYNKRVATIEVDPVSHELVQCYGRANSSLAFEDYKIIENFIHSINGWVSNPRKWYE